MNLKKLFSVAILCGAALFLTVGGVRAEEEPKTGEELFQQNCAMCHPDGGNIVQPGKTLYRRDLDTNKIKTLDDIVWLMRNPNLGMTRFHVDAMSDADARKIARYVMETFK